MCNSHSDGCYKDISCDEYESWEVAQGIGWFPKEAFPAATSRGLYMCEVERDRCRLPLGAIEDAE